MLNEEKLDRLMSRQEIYDLVCKYMRGIDRLDATLQRSTFHDDATTDYGFFAGGPDEFVALAQGILKGHLANHHMIGQTLIDIEDDVAFGEIYFQAFHRVVEDGAEYDLFIAGRYIDRYERRQGAWKIAHRSELVDWVRNSAACDQWLEGSNSLLGARGEADLSYQRTKLRSA